MYFSFFLSTASKLSIMEEADRLTIVQSTRRLVRDRDKMISVEKSEKCRNLTSELDLK